LSAARTDDHAASDHPASRPQQGFPQGSARHGYEIVAPLDADGRLSFIEWCRWRLRCRVGRFWGADPDRWGVLEPRRGGAGGATWIIDYDADETEDDDAGIHLDGRTFKVGEYVSVGDPSGTVHTFKVADVTCLAKQPARAEP
jgi:hypothetical protein